MTYTLLVFAVVVSAIVAATRRDTRRPWRPYAALCGLFLSLASVVALEGCPVWERPVCGSPRAYQCVNDQPHVCSPSQRLTPIGDEPCAATGAVCAILDGGVAACVPQDGGAP